MKAIVMHPWKLLIDKIKIEEKKSILVIVPCRTHKRVFQDSICYISLTK